MDQVTSNTESEPMEIRIISGFWRRLLAFLIDCLILGVFGMLSGVFLFETYVSLGSCGRLVGFFIALIYFGINVEAEMTLFPATELPRYPAVSTPVFASSKLSMRHVY